MTKPKIGIVVGSTRPGRFADGVKDWLWDIVSKRSDAEFEIVDLRDYAMPFFEEKVPLVYAPPENAVALRWGAKMGSLDGYIFITAEYNHSITGVLKNALDYAYFEYHRKPASFVAYGGQGGARAVEQLRLILVELQVAPLKQAVHIGATEMIGIMREGKVMADFPQLAQSAKSLLDNIIWWADALRTARANVPHPSDRLGVRQASMASPSQK